jgi:enamine deaminase RidA (YjgF/YER057c/UK114 family)
MADVERVNPPTLNDPAGRYTSVVKRGNVVFIAGQTAIDKDGNLVGEGDPLAQARQVYANIDAAIKSVGGTKDDILKTTTYVLDRDYVLATRPARNEYFGDKRPTSTMLVIPGLADPRYLIEVECEAVLS